MGWVQRDHELAAIALARMTKRKAEGKRYLCTDCDAAFNETPRDGRCGCGSGRVLDLSKNNSW
jgi:hypothetical protein